MVWSNRYLLTPIISTVLKTFQNPECHKLRSQKMSMIHTGIKLAVFPALHKVSFGAGNTTYLVIFAVNLLQWIPGGSPAAPLLTNCTISCNVFSPSFALQ